MKKALYMTLLLVCACVLGGLIGRHADGSISWLGYTTGFNFQPGNFLDTEVLSVTFGISFTINIAQIILCLVAIFVFYKTAPKIITSK